MRPPLRSWTLVGRQVVDVDGRVIGNVAGTHPPDGGGEPELVLVAVGKVFPRRRWLPLEGCAAAGDDHLIVPWQRWEIEDAPDAADCRWGEPADIARAYWVTAD